jgi:hypothetical protein
MNTQTQEALKMAIEFIEEITNAAGKYPYVNKTQLVADSYQIASKLKEALEQPAQEPVEVYGILDDGDYVSVEATKEGAIKQCEFMNKHGCNCTYKPLYTHPHQWQGLTDDEITEIYEKSCPREIVSMQNFARAIEQALKEKTHDH